MSTGSSTVDFSFSRHESRLARILELAHAQGIAISVSYLDSCDVRALPVILERLEAHARGGQPRFWGLLQRREIVDGRHPW